MVEKRNYFRVEKHVLLQIQPVDVYTATNSSADTLFAGCYSLSVLKQCHLIDQQAQETLKAVRVDYPAVANYLQYLNKKFDLLSHEFVTQHWRAEGGAEIPSILISLSEGGVAFDHDKALYTGSYLAIRLIFLPDYTAVILFAKVVRCEGKGDLHHIAAKFHRASELQQQMLARQILLWQQQDRQNGQLSR